MSETYSPAGNVSAATYRRATAAEAATGTFGDEFMRQDMTQIADRIRFLSDLGYLTFPAVFSGQADPNTLDDYEEGAWTPVLGGATSESGQAYGVVNGKYTKLGRIVIATFDVNLTTAGTVTGTARIKGLPFTSGTTSRAALALAIADTLGISVVWLYGLLESSGVYVDMYHRIAAAAAGTNSANTLWANGTQVTGTIVYST